MPTAADKNATNGLIILVNNPPVPLLLPVRAGSATAVYVTTYGHVSGTVASAASFLVDPGQPAGIFAHTASCLVVGLATTGFDPGQPAGIGSAAYAEGVGTAKASIPTRSDRAKITFNFIFVPLQII